MEKRKVRAERIRALIPLIFPQNGSEQMERIESEITNEALNTEI
jgi:hypothetical protein